MDETDFHVARDARGAAEREPFAPTSSGRADPDPRRLVMPEMATGDDEAVPRGLPRPSSKATLPTRVRPAFVELDGVVPPMHYFAGGSARERDPLLWISPNGAEVRLPEVPALRFGGTDDSTVLARFIAPNEDVTLDMVVPDEWERYDADGREVSLMTTAGQIVVGPNNGG